MRNLVSRSFGSSYSWFAFGLGCILFAQRASAEQPQVVSVEGQPLAANVNRVVETLSFLGRPLPPETLADLSDAAQLRDAARLQQLLDPLVLLIVRLNPELPVKVSRGPGPAILEQMGYRPVLVKVINPSALTKPLQITSPRSGPVYAGVAELSMKRQAQESLRENENVAGDPDRFLHLEMYTNPPMTPSLSGLAVEYMVALIYSADAGKRKATIGFDVGQGTQDEGFRGETPVLFDIQPAVPVRLSIRDHHGQPTAARLTFRDNNAAISPGEREEAQRTFSQAIEIYKQIAAESPER
jgi:hypothetical protein